MISSEIFSFSLLRHNRFGDQILQIDGNTLAGWKLSKVHDHLRKKTDPKNIKLVIRDRPFDRTITMQKDSAGRIGFVIKVWHSGPE